LAATDIASSLPPRVLIVGANYWPEESGNAPYTTGLAEDLAAHGLQVTVLCAMPHYPEWRIRDGYRDRRRIREQRNGVQLIRSWLWVPTRQSAAHRAGFESSFFANALWSARGVRRPDVIIGITPSLSGAVLARVLAWRFRVPYGLIVQDLVGPGATQSGMRGGRRVARLAASVEGSAMRGAARVGVVSEGFRVYVEEAGVAGDRVVHLPNWAHFTPSEANLEATRDSFGWPAEAQVVLHAGAMGMKQGLEQVVNAASMAVTREDAEGLLFVLLGDGSQRAALESAARGLSNVQFLPPQSVPRYADALRAADVLLISERPEMVNMSLPGKLSSYVGAGRPIVAAVPLEGATAREIRSSDVGVVTPAGDSGAMLAGIQQALAGAAVANPRAVERYRAALDPVRALERNRAFVADVADRGPNRRGTHSQGRQSG